VVRSLIPSSVMMVTTSSCVTSATFAGLILPSASIRPSTTAFMSSLTSTREPSRNWRRRIGPTSPSTMNSSASWLLHSAPSQVQTARPNSPISAVNRHSPYSGFEVTMNRLSAKPGKSVANWPDFAAAMMSPGLCCLKADIALASGTKFSQYSTMLSLEWPMCSASPSHVSVLSQFFSTKPATLAPNALADPFPFRKEATMAHLPSSGT